MLSYSDSESPRRSPPNRRAHLTQRASVGGETLFLSVGRSDDGSVNEVFLRMKKPGTALDGMLDALAITVSLGLQHGVPLGSFIHALRGADFAPNGPVGGSRTITHARSILDYVAQELEAMS